MSDAKTIRLRRYPYDPDSTIEVTLRPRPYSDAEHDVIHDGKVIGSVGAYLGSLDRKIKGTRLIHPGKRRKLWYARAPREHARALYEYVSRAEAIRTLLRP